MKSTDVERGPNANIYTFMDDSKIRSKFIKKVYAILTAQVLYTCAVVIAVLNTTDLKLFAARHHALIYMSCSLATMGLLLALTCSVSLRRSYPLNFLLLFLFTTLCSIQLSALSARSPITNVYLATFLTAGLFVLLTGLAYAQIFDISNYGGILCVSSLILVGLNAVVFMLGFLFGFYYKPFYVILTSIVIFLALIYIVYDTQIILGEGKVRIEEEEYIAAVLCLYTDIITLFTHILALLNIFDVGDNGG